MPRILLILAALSFIPTLFFYMVGEEGIYTISTLEMLHSRDWFTQTLYGINLQRPPLMNWLALPLANLLGWSQVLIAIRLLSVAATLGMAAWLYWLCRKLFSDKTFALFTTLACLSLADLQLYRGWLAYTDPLFAFLTFGAMATLWVATAERHRGWLFMSVVLVSCALLTKAFTAYIFYATVIFVLLWQRDARKFLLTPVSLLVLSSTLIIPYAWFSSLPHQGGQSSSMMLHEIIIKLIPENGWAYLQRLFTYPMETAFWLAPVTLLAAYLVLRNRVWQAETSAVNFQGALLITGLTILPYWLAPQGGIRYLLPVYPMVALVSARYIWRAGEPARKLALRWFAGLRNRVWQAETSAVNFQGALLITGLTILPYWLAPQGGIRYLLPVYPMVALVSARYIWRAGEPARKLALRWFAGLIAFKFLFAINLFPYYQTHYRGKNYEKTAQLIIKRTHGFPLYMTDVSSIGLSITAHMEKINPSGSLLLFPPKTFDSGYVLSRNADPSVGEIAETYKLASDKIFLLCRGTACQQNTAPP